MYFMYVSTDRVMIGMLEDHMRRVNNKIYLVNVSSGFDLIRLLQNTKRGESYPDLIILTNYKTRLNGTELLELLKTDDMYRLIPVVMFFPEYDPDEEACCKRLGSEIIQMPAQSGQWKDAAEKICNMCN